MDVKTYQGHYGASNFGITYWLKTEVLKCLVDFMKQLAIYTRLIDTQAFQRGTSIMTGLASGKISMKEFNDRVLDK